MTTDHVLCDIRVVSSYTKRMLRAAFLIHNDVGIPTRRSLSLPLSSDAVPDYANAELSLLTRSFERVGRGGSSAAIMAAIEVLPDAWKARDVREPEVFYRPAAVSRMLPSGSSTPTQGPRTRVLEGEATSVLGDIRRQALI